MRLERNSPIISVDTGPSKFRHVSSNKNHFVPKYVQIKRRGKTNHLFCARNKNPFLTNHGHCYYYDSILVIIDNSQTGWLKLPIVQYSDKNYETDFVPPLLVSDRV